MIVILAFICGFAVCALSLVAPHARSQKSSIDEFVDFQHQLSSLPTVSSKNHQHVNN